MIPTVSVIIPTYNRTKTLIEAVDSCMSQKGVQTEIIVVDDGSTDGSIDILIDKYPEVRMFKQKHLGACAARNRGVKEAKGQFIKFLDSDDKLAPDVLSNQADFLIKSKADVVYGDFEMFGNLNDTRVAGIPHRIPGYIDDPVDSLLGDWWCAPFCYMYQKKAIGNQLWDEDLECLQDFDFILRFAISGNTFKYLPGLAGYYRIHEGQITGSSDYRYGMNRCKILEKVLKELNLCDKLTENRKQLIAHGLWTAARAFYRSDRKLFHDTVARIYELVPHFRPKFWGSWTVLMLTGILGIEKTEEILAFRRRILKK